MARKTKRQTKANGKALHKREAIELEILDPEHFPDLAAVRGFVTGDGANAMECAIQEALNPFRDEPEHALDIPPTVMRSARHAADKLTHDLRELSRAAVRGAPVEPVAYYDDAPGVMREHHRERLDLLMLTLVSVPDWSPHILESLLRYLGDPPEREERKREAAA